MNERNPTVSPTASVAIDAETTAREAAILAERMWDSGASATAQALASLVARKRAWAVWARARARTDARVPRG